MLCSYCVVAELFWLFCSTLNAEKCNRQKYKKYNHVMNRCAMHITDIELKLS